MPTELAPLQLPLDRMPRTFGSWTGDDVRLDPQLFQAIGAEMVINRRYRDKEAAVELHGDVFTKLFMRAGVRTPHQPEECYANNGFIVESSETVRIPTPGDGSQPARLLTLSRDGSRVYCLYWYQVGETTFWNSDNQRRVVQAFRGRPTWPPMIKVMLQTSANSSAEAQQRLTSLAGLVYAWTRRVPLSPSIEPTARPVPTGDASPQINATFRHPHDAHGESTPARVAAHRSIVASTGPIPEPILLARRGSDRSIVDGIVRGPCADARCDRRCRTTQRQPNRRRVSPPGNRISSRRPHPARATHAIRKTVAHRPHHQLCNFPVGSVLGGAVCKTAGFGRGRD